MMKLVVDGDRKHWVQALSPFPHNPLERFLPQGR